ncbi:MAG: glycosyltransferase family 2 protein, partial [Acidobacteria bacterium]|nr:glycosyltransferase family 2 protein [Acidobacteriota bacterium]
MSDAGAMKYSVIVPTCGRPVQLSRCLEALAGLRYDRSGFEVIVVDDGGEQALERLVSRYEKRMRIRLLRQPRSGPAAARNAGAGIALGRILAFTDDDCEPAADWLEQLEIRLEGFPRRVVGGRTVNALSENVFAEASQMLIGYLYEYYNRRPNGSRFLASCNLAAH